MPIARTMNRTERRPEEIGESGVPFAEREEDGEVGVESVLTALEDEREDEK